MKKVGPCVNINKIELNYFQIISQFFLFRLEYKKISNLKTGKFTNFRKIVLFAYLLILTLITEIYPQKLCFGQQKSERVSGTKRKQLMKYHYGEICMQRSKPKRLSGPRAALN